MLALEFTFPAGRYHATPWDRHVNEGALAWPPEPWRLLRALIATWHHKIKPLGIYQEADLLGLIESLAEELPQYRLPKASHSHVRHYMPQYHAGKTSLVFDAFAAVGRDDPLQVIWPTLILPDEQIALLDELLSAMGYLGRAESWVEARRIDNPEQADCYPAEDAVDTETGELMGEAVTLYAPVSSLDYQQRREGFLTGKKPGKALVATLPGRFVDALSVDTAALRKQGWNQPPAARKVRYLRPVDALRPCLRSQPVESPPFTSVVYQLTGKPLPKVEESVRIGELMRMAVMSRFGKQADGKIPSSISGHDLGKHNRHQHAFYLPFDANGDGRIDRLLLHVPMGLGTQERRVLEKLNRIWSRDGNEWRLVLEGVGDRDVGLPLLQSAKEWCSVTPYLHPWHQKKNLTVADQIRRECRERGLPEPVSIEPMDAITVADRARRTIDFRRFRSKRDLRQPDRHGSAWHLVFEQELSGPLALGFGCHFGLGLFAPTGEGANARR